MILTIALDNGYLYSCLIAILTSVVSAVYYLVIVKTMFFEKNNFNYNKDTYNFFNDKISFTLTSYISFIISFLTNLILLFVFYYQEILWIFLI